MRTPRRAQLRRQKQSRHRPNHMYRSLPRRPSSCPSSELLPLGLRSANSGARPGCQTSMRYSRRPHSPQVKLAAAACIAWRSGPRRPGTEYRGHWTYCDRLPSLPPTPVHVFARQLWSGALDNIHRIRVLRDIALELIGQNLVHSRLEGLALALARAALLRKQFRLDQCLVRLLDQFGEELGEFSILLFQRQHLVGQRLGLLRDADHRVELLDELVKSPTVLLCRQVSRELVSLRLCFAGL